MCEAGDPTSGHLLLVCLLVQVRSNQSHALFRALKPGVSATMSLSQAKEAQELSETGKRTGR